LGYWGMPAGPYLQIPFLGPSTVRDAPALIVDYHTHPRNHLFEGDTWLAASTLDAVRIRAGLLPTEAAIMALHPDRYVALRNAWLQRREFLVRDGVPGNDARWQEELDFLDELEALEQDAAAP
jgi:phospholipid-binding lipoprotein MlaA